MEWQTIAAGAAAVVAGVAAIIAFWQADSAKKQADSARTQAVAAKSQADSASTQAEQAKRQADFAGEATSVARDQLALASDQLSEIRAERKDRQKAEQIAALDVFVTASTDLVLAVENYVTRRQDAIEAGGRFPPIDTRQVDDLATQAGQALGRAGTNATLAYVRLIASGYPYAGPAKGINNSSNELTARAWREQPLNDLNVQIIRELRMMREGAARAAEAENT